MNQNNKHLMQNMNILWFTAMHNLGNNFLGHFHVLRFVLVAIHLWLQICSEGTGDCDRSTVDGTGIHSSSNGNLLLYYVTKFKGSSVCFGWATVRVET